MSRRTYMSRFECGAEGCREFASYESGTRADQTRLWQKYANGKWRCVRHSKAHEVLSIDDNRKVHEVVNTRQIHDGRDIGLFFGHFGFVSGPGFKAFAKDFPEGTVLRVTAEIILPTQDPTPPTTSMQEDAK